MHLCTLLVANLCIICAFGNISNDFYGCVNYYFKILTTTWSVSHGSHYTGEKTKSQTDDMLKPWSQRDTCTLVHCGAVDNSQEAGTICVSMAGE